LGGLLCGFHCRVAVEIEPYCREVLLQRQLDGCLPRFPIWDDVKTFDGKPWQGKIDVITGGFPCQDISSAGKGAGLAGSRSGLVFEMLRIVDEVRPKYVFAENSPNLRTRGLGRILKELNSLGYDARWCVLGAWHIGAPHRRNRMWILATDSDSEPIRQQPRRNGRENRQEAAQPAIDGQTQYVADADSAQRQRVQRTHRVNKEYADISGQGWWSAKSGLGRVVNELASELDVLGTDEKGDMG